MYNYGTRLFTRDKKGLGLTEAGSILFTYAERIMLLAFEADQSLLGGGPVPRPRGRRTGARRASQEPALAEKASVVLTDIQSVPLILRERGSGIRQVVMAAVEEQAVSLSVLLEAGSVPFIKDLVAKGAGVTILTRISVEDEVRAGDLCAVSFAGEGLWVHVDIVVPREGYRSFPVRAFLQYLAEHGAEALPAEAPPERIGEQELVSE